VTEREPQGLIIGYSSKESFDRERKKEGSNDLEGMGPTLACTPIEGGKVPGTSISEDRGQGDGVRSCRTPRQTSEKKEGREGVEGGNFLNQFLRIRRDRERYDVGL